MSKTRYTPQTRIACLLVGKNKRERWYLHPGGVVERCLDSWSDEEAGIETWEDEDDYFDDEGEDEAETPSSRWRIVGAVEMRAGRIVKRYSLDDIVKKRVPWRTAGGTMRCHVLNSYRGTVRPLLVEVYPCR